MTSHSSVFSVNLGKVGSPKCVSFGFSRDKSDCYPGLVILVIILQLLTDEGEEDSECGSQEPEVAGESSESVICQHLVNLTELFQLLVESEVSDGSISSNVGCEE